MTHDAGPNVCSIGFLGVDRRHELENLGRSLAMLAPGTAASLSRGEAMALVAWRDRRWGTNDDVYATRVSPSGVVEEPAGVPVAASATDEAAPAVTGGPGTTWRVAYERFAAEAPYGANRVFLRSVSPK